MTSREERDPDVLWPESAYNASVHTGMPSRWTLGLCLLLVGISCSREESSGGSADSDAGEHSEGMTDATPWESPGVSETTTHTHFTCDLDDPEPSWTLEEVSAMLEETLGYGLPNPVHFEDRYTTLLFSRGTVDCPGPHGDGDDFFHLTCTTEEGYTFEGIALRSRKEIVDASGALELWSLSGDFSITYPSDEFGPGAALRGAGGLSSQAVTRDGAMVWFLSWNGSWSDEPTEGWMKQGISLLVEMTGGVTADDRRHLSVTGGISVGQTDLYFDEVSWDESGACDGMTTGTIWIRESSGHWYTWALGDDCDGCGPVIFSDSLEMGELCLDLWRLEETAVQVVPGKYTVVVPDTGESLDSGGAP